MIVVGPEGGHATINQNGLSDVRPYVVELDLGKIVLVGSLMLHKMTGEWESLNKFWDGGYMCHIWS